VSGHGLAQILTLTICHLNSAISVFFDRFSLSHCAWAGLKDSYRGNYTVITDDLGHTNLGAEDDFHLWASFPIKIIWLMSGIHACAVMDLTSCAKVTFI
jgi:hypothetical protein